MILSIRNFTSRAFKKMRQILGVRHMMMNYDDYSTRKLRKSIARIDEIMEKERDKPKLAENHYVVYHPVGREDLYWVARFCEDALQAMIHAGFIEDDSFIDVK